MLDITLQRSNFNNLAKAEWIEAFAGAIDHVNSGSCPQHLVNALGTLVKFDMAMSVVYSRHCKPFYVYDTFRTEKAKQGL